MKNASHIALLFFLTALFSCNQKPAHLLKVDLKEISVDGAPRINSYTYASDGNTWLIIGGRTDGLHDHRPELAYPKDSSNRWVWVIDVPAQKVWSAGLEELNQSLEDQMQSTNMAFYQDNDQLILIGGYGWSEEASDHITFPYLTVVDIPGLISAVKTEKPIKSFFDQIHDERMSVSGGYLGKIDDTWLLVFGNRFDGKYSARPNEGHTQEYTNEIRRFRLIEKNNSIKIADFAAVRDTAHFHRRDFNMLPQIFPNNKFGYTVFSGVFQYNRNFPWLYPVNIFKESYKPVENFEQKFSHYHGACVSLHRKEKNQTDNLFFGGMARFVPDPETGEIINDPLVPSVNTISQVTRFGDGTLSEEILNTKMPGLLGASANFIPAADVPVVEKKIVDYDRLAQGKSLIGYIYGGLESSQPNIFLQASGVSRSTDRIFEVYLVIE